MSTRRHVAGWFASTCAVVGAGVGAGLIGAGAQTGTPAGAPLVAYTVEHDAILAPLGGVRGDAMRGRAVLFDADRGNCTICHPLPDGDARTQGNVAPTLAGVAGRLSEGQMRLRLVDGTRINPDTVMPPYYRVEGLNRVAPAFAGRSVLAATEVEDVIAYLLTLKP